VRAAEQHSRESDVRAISQSVLGDTPVSIRPIVEDGVVNAVFSVETSRRELVFRIQFDSHEVGAFRKEQWCMDAARAAGVPGAEVVAVGTYGAHAYAIHTRLPGVVGTRYTGGHDGVWHELGRLARRFHSVEARGFGEHLGGPVGDAPDATLAAWVDGWVRRAFDSSLLVEGGVLSARELDQARRIVARIRDWTGRPQLCHGNLSLSNVLVDGDDVYVIDWGTAAGHLAPLFDLAELSAWSPENHTAGLHAFLSGYDLSSQAYGAMTEALETLQLWRVLTGAHWMLETDRARQEVLAFVADKARGLLERVQ
jgi:aminoglycoside phosphotransferase (APT) family kinase protein